MFNTFPHGHALSIGVGGSDLPNTITDAIGLADLLTDPTRCAYPPEQVHLLTGERATRAAILAALDTLAQTATPQSTVIVYFSGHGAHAVSSLGDIYFLMPHGYDVTRLAKTAVRGDEFARSLRRIPAQKLLLLLDCCHAAGIGEAKAAGQELVKSPLPPEAQELFAQGGGRVLIASSQAGERSFGGRPYSAFTLALIEALCGQGASKPDGYVRVADLALHAREMVPQRTQNRQHPILSFEQADNFVLGYYAGGEAQPKGLPFESPIEIEPEPGAWSLAITQAIATVIGDGTVVQGNNNTVVGAGGVLVKGNVQGDMVTGAKITQEAGDHTIQIGQARDVKIERKG